MPSRALLSDTEEAAERSERDTLRQIDGKLRTLFDRREELIVQVRKVSAEQKAAYEQRQAPQAEVERLYEDHNALGKRIADLRKARELARKKVDDAIIRVREVRLTFTPGERVRPEQIRKEIAELELRQQTRALKLDEENALIAQLRQRAKDLKEVEARAATVAEHQRKLKEAEAGLLAVREEFDRAGKEMAAAKSERDAKMVAVRDRLEKAGALIAALRAKGRERADIVARIDALSREMDELDHEARKIVARSRSRRDEARKMLRTYSKGRGVPSEDVLASAAEAQLEELLKRGRITLGG